MRQSLVQGRRGRKGSAFDLGVQPLSERPVVEYGWVLAIFVCEVAFLCVPEVGADKIGEGTSLDVEDLLHGLIRLSLAACGYSTYVCPARRLGD